MADVAVLGLWHLGAVGSAGWCSLGRNVVAWDSDSALRANLRAGEPQVHEPQLAELLKEGIQENHFTVLDDCNQAIASAPVTHLAFDTNVTDEGDVDDDRLDEAVNRFAVAAPQGALLLISSQLPVGTCKRWFDLLKRERPDTHIAYIPENLRLGKAVDDFLYPARMVVGADEDEAAELTAIALKGITTPIRNVGLTAAELVKHATNAYLATCIVFANELAWVADHLGADPFEVIEGLRDDHRVSPDAPLRPGTAFSGATLKRDVRRLAQVGAEYGRPELYETLLALNERHANIALAWLHEELGENISGKSIAVLGLTYKPGTNTLRDSLPLKLATKLREESARVTAYDPDADPLPVDLDITRASDIKSCVQNVDATLVLSPLPELTSVNWSGFAPASHLLIDTCGALQREQIEEAGWKYRGY